MATGNSIELVGALAKFNRKERYWLLRNSIGNVGLTKSFVGRLKDALQLKIPDDAWWAIDYHFDWLAGAMCCLGGKKDVTLQQAGKLIAGNQEDVDLIVAFKNTIILIEAKADTGWSESQRNSKLDRLDDLRGLIEELGLDVKVRFLLISTQNTIAYARTEPRAA